MHATFEEPDVTFCKSSIQIFVLSCIISSRPKLLLVQLSVKKERKKDGDFRLSPWSMVAIKISAGAENRVCLARSPIH